MRVRYTDAEIHANPALRHFVGIRQPQPKSLSERFWLVKFDGFSKPQTVLASRLVEVDE